MNNDHCGSMITLFVSPGLQCFTVFTFVRVYLKLGHGYSGSIS